MNAIVWVCGFLGGLLLLRSLAANAAEVATWPLPAGEPRSTDYQVTVEDKDVGVYVAASRHGGDYSFCSFDMSGRVKVVVRSARITGKTVIRPASYGIKANVKDGELSFLLDRPRKLSIEPDGINAPLLLFANPMEKDAPSPDDPNVRYFGPGVHKPERIVLESGQTLYLAGGAVVKAGVTIDNATNVRICGRGILDGNDWPWLKGPTRHMIAMRNSSNIAIQDITIRGSFHWTIVPSNCRNVTVTNVKLANSRVENDDGVNPCSSQNVTIRDCFIRTDDDCIAMKGMARRDGPKSPVKGITVRSCVLWCGQMRIFLLGHESAADAMEDITVTDCDIIHYAVNPPFFLEPGENMVLRNVTFQDIRVDGDGQRDFITLHPTVNQYMRVKEPGSIRNVLFKDITLSMPGKGLAYVIVEGADDKHTVQDVTFQNVVRCGKLLAPGQPGVAVGPYTSGIRFLGPGGAKTQPATRGGKAPGSRPSKATTSSQPQSGAPPADKALTLTLAGGVTMEFVLIPSGTFAMGSPPDEAGRNDDECPQRQVAIPKPFYMGIHEVTQEQYAAVMGTDPSNFKGATRPAERVTWEDTVEFCSRLSGSTGKAIRLPTEAEWEYACRAGSKARFCYGDDVDYSGLGQYAWYGANSAGQTHPVGQKQHNAWGLYDMHGNVWEWCGDIYTDPRPGAKNHYPREPVCRTRRVLRGGCWIDGPMNCRSATRSWILAGHGDLSIGFRVVADLG